MRFDASDPSKRKARRAIVIDTKGEDDILPARRILLSAALGRDLEADNAVTAAHLLQIKSLVIGTGPKLQFFDEALAEHASWFNEVWAKECDGCDDTPIAELLANALSGAFREGDQLWVFDDFDRMDGTVRIFESDQMPTVRETDWGSSAPPLYREDGKAMAQARGIVKDSRGRCVAYIAHGKYGQQEAEFKDVTVFGRWHPRWGAAGSARLFKLPWRPNQHRGKARLQTVANLQGDVYELLDAELASAKAAADRFASIEQDKEGLSGVERALQAAGKTPDEIQAMLYGDGTNAGIAAAQYENLETAYGGRMDYLNPGDTLKIHDHDRPSSSVVEATEFIQRLSGAVLGLSRARATMKADASYTAFRGEEIMTKQTTTDVLRKAVERRLLDFLVRKAIPHGVAKDGLPAVPADFWRKASWSWPTLPEVDDFKAANAERIRLKNGSLTLAEMWGPNWRKIAASLAEQVNTIRDLDIPLSIREGVSGGQLEETQTNPDTGTP